MDFQSELMNLRSWLTRFIPEHADKADNLMETGWNAEGEQHKMAKLYEVLLNHVPEDRRAEANAVTEVEMARLRNLEAAEAGCHSGAAAGITRVVLEESLRRFLSMQGLSGEELAEEVRTYVIDWSENLERLQEILQEQYGSRMNIILSAGANHNLRRHMLQPPS